MRPDDSNTELWIGGLESLDWDAGRSMEQVAGRGSVRLVDTNLGTAVIRHYRRGGRIAALLADRYWYRGADSTRCFREFRVLSRLQQLGLPACRPLAARYMRSGLFYRADLATLLIPQSQSLHQVLCSDGPSADLACAVARMLARFHRAGLWHADLNAHNILRDGSGSWWLIDLDRARFRAPAEAWRRGNLRRLERSLHKLGHVSRSIGGSAGMFLQSFHEAYAKSIAVIEPGS
jgi:3-deoxy-D-manno-octulosonic acid kinase